MRQRYMYICTKKHGDINAWDAQQCMGGNTVTEIKVFYLGTNTSCGNGTDTAGSGDSSVIGESFW